MDKYDISQLTEFPRYESEPNHSGVSTFFNKIWKFPLFLTSENTENAQPNLLIDNKQLETQCENGTKQDDDNKTEFGSYAVEFEGRSLPNVLKRISSLVALDTGGGTKYADTELARYWMPDDISHECYECATRFRAFRRRHHCRVCGQIFCSRCCSQRVPGHIFGCAGGLRVCNYCCNIVLSYLRENDMTGEMSPDLRTLQESLQVKFPDNKSQNGNKGRDNFTFARDQEERCEPCGSPKEALQDVFRQLAFSLPTQVHRYRLVRYTGVWRGCDILQWLMDNTNNKTRVQATSLCESLLSAGYMECVTEMPQFADYALYRPITLEPLRLNEEDSPEECKRLIGSVSSYCLDLNLGESSARLTKAQKPARQPSSSSDEDSPNPILEHNEGSIETNNLCKSILESGEDHLRLLMRQCLARESLSASWLDVLYPLCQQASEIILPDVCSNNIDVRHYVQVKKVPGGAVTDSCVVHGVVLTKNVAHRGMPQNISNPSILLLDCSIAYQRVEGKLTSFEPMLMQEQEYLARCAARISALQPKVVLVRGSAARAVQDALRAEGVALAVGVRARALHRTSRCCRAEIVTSIDARIGTPRLGTCRNFYVNNYSGKTLMVLEGGPESNLGCCILLRGASLLELIRVKKVVNFMLLACYNWKLEKSFLGDIESVLPEPGMTFGEDDEMSHDDVFNFGDNDSKCGKFDSVDSEKVIESNSLIKNDSVLKTKPDEVVNENSDETEIKTISENSNNNSKLINAEFDDPLQRAKHFSRKTDSDKNLSCGVPIRDFSDPLRATLSVDDDVFLPKEETKLKADTHSDRWSTDDVVLSMSPNVVIPAPYLETEAGRKCPLRDYFPQPLLTPAPRPHPPHTPRTLHRKLSRPQQKDVVMKEDHPFLTLAITSGLDDNALRTTLAHYRATGSRVVNSTVHTPGCSLYPPSVVKKVQKQPEIEANDKKNTNDLEDPFLPENHQRLSLLLYSYSSKSSNVPDFCVNPWIVTMDMYGRHDISLGAFLEKYCFNGDYKCPSTNCLVPMNQHVRRFVHGEVCITITCNTIGHSHQERGREEHTNQVMFWSRCETCGVVGRARRLSRLSLSLSLGMYLRLRLAAPRYVRRTCPHPLHSHSHAFACRLTTACFRYNKISTFDIQLPPDVISINYDTKQIRDALINQLNELVQKGHESFSSVTDGEAEKDYQAFKQHMEQIHLALTSASLQEHPTQAGVVRSLWTVSDRIIIGEKMLREAQEKWSGPPAKPVKSQPDNSSEEKSDLEDSSGDVSSDNSGTTYVFAPDTSSKELEKEHTGGEEDEERGDKKTVRHILSQLLSNNQPLNQSGMIISSGLVPVVVQAGEIGSVIAATLASVTYQRALKMHKYSSQNDPEENESTGSSGKEKAETEKTKASKDHIEVLLKDGLICRVYYAPQFQRLRHMLLAPLSSIATAVTSASDMPADSATTPAKCCDEAHKNDGKTLCDVEEGFIRSLAHCVPWAARGGKSGSTFCKTKDDRYVLKEMTKPEWQQFLEFAPHYFNYVISCRQHKLPSLLARILGVYSVGGAGNGVLVMENVWYTCGPNARRFDLKGSSRHRLTPDTRPLAVLMDENLLNLRWECQLYIQSHTGSVLWACVERDTQFLATNGVMDYSLLLGIDDRTLVLGVIDYIRTFTWDKKLEHLVKKNLGSGQPTVVSPEQYKRRFSIACRKYFLQCPTHWDHLLPILHA